MAAGTANSTGKGPGASSDAPQPAGGPPRPWRKFFKRAALRPQPPPDNIAGRIFPPARLITSEQGRTYVLQAIQQPRHVAG